MRPFRLGLLALASGCFGLIGFLLITAPRGMDPARFDGLVGDSTAGERVFHASGCASCHMAPDAKGDAQLILSGGQAFATDFGTFYAPNISSDPEFGIGGWTLLEFGEAVQCGISPLGRHLYPAMPYVAYEKMTPQEVADLKAFMDGLPRSDAPSLQHDLPFPFNLRRGLGLWKLLYQGQGYAVSAKPGTIEERGRHLVEAMAHCAECHSPRTAFGGLDRSRWLGGAPSPDGKGKVPDITPAALDWTSDEIVTYLRQGTTPDFDFAGGPMAHVVENFAKLPPEDAQAVAAYLKSLPGSAP